MVLNCTEWSAIWSEIKRVIQITTSLISEQNCTTQSAISTLLHSCTLKSTSGNASLFTKYAPKLAPSFNIATCEQNGRDIKKQ